MRNYHKLYFALLAGTILSTTANYAAAATITPILDTIKAEAADISGSYKLDELSGDLPEGAAEVEISGVKYYFTPSGTDAALLKTLAGTSAGNLTEDENGIFELNGKKYSFNSAAIPTSAFIYTDGTESDYNFTVEEADAEGNLTTKYYKVVLKPETFSTSESIEWSTSEPTAGDITGSMEINLPNNKKQTFYYTYTKPEGYDVITEEPKKLETDRSESIKLGLGINNTEEDYGNIESSVFIGNRIEGNSSATSKTGMDSFIVSGGIIYNTGNIDDVKADFVDNQVNVTGAESSQYVYGGVIYNQGSIGDIYGDFVNNSAVASSEEYLKGVMTESQAAQTEAITSGTQSQIISLQDLSETQQAVVQSMNETWQSYADQATNMFDTLSDDSELSVAEMTQNLLENQRVISEWATNIDTLAKRGINEGLLEQLRQAGPESAGYVNAMVQASDAELQALSEAFANGGETATNALKTVFDTSTVPESAMNLITKTQQTLNEQITAADFSSLGQNVGQGLSEGISSSSETAATAAGAMATGVNEAAANTLGVHSPSTVFMGYGQDLINGLVIGMQGQSGTLNATMTMLMTSAGQAAANALNSQLNQMSNVTGASFTKIPAAAQSSMQMTAAVVGSGMSGVTQKITAGMKLSETATKSGMKAMNAAVKSDMQTIKSSAESGMDAFENSINRGMNQSKNSVVRGGNSMVSAVRNLRSGFYSSGYYASAGLAQGINAGAGAAIAAANRLASQVAATMNRALKVGSPSRVTREIGGFTTEGFVLGILDDVRAVKRAAVQVAEAALPSGSIADRFAYAGAYVPDSRFEYTETMDATYTIIVPVILEGREIARVTAPYTEAELNKKQKVKNMIKGIKG